MNITTSPKIWAHRTLLTVVHKANELIEREAGVLSESLAVYWSLDVSEEKSEPTLQMTVVNAASPQTPFTFTDTLDLQGLRREFRKWCGSSDHLESGCD
jgi:hypothetical protein